MAARKAAAGRARARTGLGSEMAVTRWAAVAAKVVAA